MQLFINGESALILSKGEQIPWSVDEVSGAVVDHRSRAPTGRGLSARRGSGLQRLKHYRGQVKLPPGFVALVPGQQETALQLRTVAMDREGHQTVIDQPLRIEADVATPLVEVLRPVLGRNVVEGTSVLVEVSARDNVLVDRVEILAGPSASALSVVHVASGFPPTNAVPGSPFDVYAPLVRYALTVPTLEQLGSTVPVPYFVAARARDISGNWTAPADFVIQPIEIIRDRPPGVSILSPADGAPAVAGSTLTVVVMAEDDVAVGNVRLEVDGVPLPVALHAPPFSFQVQVPARQGELSLRAVAVDSGGHEVGSQVVILPLREDQAPTVAVAQPRSEARLTEGKDFALVVAAQDDVAVRSVEVLVEGGLAGPLRLVASSLPYAFRVPLPPGSAGRTLRMIARARDSAGHEAVAPEVTALVVTDTTPPTVTWLHPAEGAQALEGSVLELEVDARDDVVVNSLELRLNDQPLAFMPVPPFRMAYRVPADAGGKSLVFSATARDPSGNQTAATRLLEIVEDEPPSVSVIAPTRLVVGSPALLRAQASDDVAVTEVGFHVGTDPSALSEVARRYQLPYEFRYTPAEADVGKVLTIRSRAVDLVGPRGVVHPRAGAGGAGHASVRGDQETAGGRGHLRGAAPAPGGRGHGRGGADPAGGILRGRAQGARSHRARGHSGGSQPLRHQLQPPGGQRQPPAADHGGGGGLCPSGDGVRPGPGGHGARHGAARDTARRAGGLGRHHRGRAAAGGRRGPG